MASKQYRWSGTTRLRMPPTSTTSAISSSHDDRSGTCSMTCEAIAQRIGTSDGTRSRRRPSHATSTSTISPTCRVGGVLRPDRLGVGVVDVEDVVVGATGDRVVERTELDPRANPARCHAARPCADDPVGQSWRSLHAGSGALRHGWRPTLWHVGEPGCSALVFRGVSTHGTRDSTGTGIARRLNRVTPRLGRWITSRRDAREPEPIDRRSPRRSAAAWDDDGFLVLRRFFDAARLDACAGRPRRAVEPPAYRRPRAGHRCPHRHAQRATTAVPRRDGRRPAAPVQAERPVPRVSTGSRDGAGPVAARDPRGAARGRSHRVQLAELRARQPAAVPLRHLLHAAAGREPDARDVDRARGLRPGCGTVAVLPGQPQDRAVPLRRTVG